MMKKMIFLFNPRSGKEAIKNQLSDILGIFCRAGYLPSVYVTQEPGDAAKIAEEYGSEVELFVCSGGDGTLNSVISGIMKLKKRPEIGYLPSGSTNDFARSLKIPANLTEAARDVVSGKSYGVDIGKFGDQRYFVYIAAFGAFTEVSYSTPQDVKNVLGHQAYILESIKALGKLKSYKMHIAWDDGEADGEFIFGMVTNTTSVGGFSGLAPKDVSFHDGLFEGLFIRTPKSPVDLPNILSGLLLFPEQENKEMIRFKSSKFTVTADEDVPWVLDGEFGGAVKEAKIENVKEAVTLSCSPEPEKKEEKTEN